MAFLISISWGSSISPVNFFALRALNLFFSFEKVNSIGLYSGEYARLKMYLNSNSRIFFTDLSQVWLDKLSMKRQILSVPFRVRSSWRYSPNF